MRRDTRSRIEHQVAETARRLFINHKNKDEVYVQWVHPSFDRPFTAIINRYKFHNSWIDCVRDAMQKSLNHGWTRTDDRGILVPSSDRSDS